MTDVHISEQDSALAAIGAGRLLPVIALQRAADAPDLAEALLAGGLPCAEVTFRTDAAAEAIATMSTYRDLFVGAGTVLTAAQVDQAVDAGARFVVSPGFSSTVVRRCQQLGVPVYPGVATATDIQLALEAGLSTVKFFPAEQNGGVAMVKALAAPFKQVRFIPTGGVTAANVASYLALDAVVACGGTWMVPADALDQQDWDRVTALVREAVKAVAR